MSATTTAGGTRRAELAAFLRSRRERITPGDVGLPPGIRRRTSGLRREEVAMLAGVGVTWYTWLEQGRRINASTQVLDAVARTLKLDQPEREHLYRLADVPAAAAAAADGATQVARVAPEMQRILDGMTTLPASILNERFDLLAWNHAYAALFPGVVRQPACERNTLWLSFTYAPCCHPYLNRDEQLGTLVAQLRAAYGRHVGEAAWTKFVRRLQAASPEFSKLWAQHEVASPTTFRHPAHDRLVMNTTSLGILAAPGTRMVVYTPADDVTCAAVASLIAGHGADARYPCWDAHRGRREEDERALAV